MQHRVLILGFYKGKSAKNEPKISFGGWGAGRLWNYSLLTCTDPSQRWEQSHQRQRWDGTSHNPRCEETSRLDLCQVRWALLDNAKTCSDNASIWRRKKLQLGTCPVRIAKLPLRHIFATVSLAPLAKVFANGSLKTNIGWTWAQKKICNVYQVAVRAHIVFMDPEYGTTSLCALTSVGKPARPIKRTKYFKKDL